MAVDYSVYVKIDSTVTADEKATILRKILAVLASKTIAPTYNTTHTNGNVVLTIT